VSASFAGLTAAAAAGTGIPKRRHHGARGGGQTAAHPGTSPGQGCPRHCLRSYGPGVGNPVFNSDNPMFQSWFKTVILDFIFNKKSPEVKIGRRTAMILCGLTHGDSIIKKNSVENEPKPWPHGILTPGGRGPGGWPEGAVHRRGLGPGPRRRCRDPIKGPSPSPPPIEGGVDGWVPPPPLGTRGRGGVDTMANDWDYRESRQEKLTERLAGIGMTTHERQKNAMYRNALPFAPGRCHLKKNVRGKKLNALAGEYANPTAIQW